MHRYTELHICTYKYINVHIRTYMNVYNRIYNIHHSHNFALHYVSVLYLLWLHCFEKYS